MSFSTGSIIYLTLTQKLRLNSQNIIKLVVGCALTKISPSNIFTTAPVINITEISQGIFGTVCVNRLITF